MVKFEFAETIDIPEIALSPNMFRKLGRQANTTETGRGVQLGKDVARAVVVAGELIASRKGAKVQRL